MLNSEISIPAAILALLRGDLSARCLADRFGVTEAMVNEWKDVFVVAGILAVNAYSNRPKMAFRVSGNGLGNATTWPPESCLAGATTTPLATTPGPTIVAPTTSAIPTTLGPTTPFPISATTQAGPKRRTRSPRKK